MIDTEALSKFVDQAIEAKTVIGFGSYCNCLLTHYAAHRSGKPLSAYLPNPLYLGLQEPHIDLIEKDAGVTGEERREIAQGWDDSKHETAYGVSNPLFRAPGLTSFGFKLGCRYLKGVGR